MNNEFKKERSNNDKKKAMLGWLSIIFCLIFVFISFAGYNIYPESQIFKILWWSIWLIGLPVMLILSIKVINKQKKE